ncbi:MAG: helix-turn-helix domain-containing protein [Firmicutes bacterium]|nr:helix-turn-helix domain-containing protein [Bacillota bacterium]
MNQYIKGEVIKTLREKNRMTQAELADKIGVTDKAVSKWETGRGLPDITLIEPIAKALSLSVGELFAGEQIINKNVVSNMRRAQLYVCPICGNVIQSTGDAALSCCGVTLPALEAEKPDDRHQIKIETIEDEYYVSMDHPMTKDHYISFLIYRTGDRIDTVKLYPEGNAECRFFRRGQGEVYAYCNRHGLFRRNL